MKVKFGVFSDLHVDIMHDTQHRLEVFLDACRKEDVDFIIQLGDFCYPDDDRKCVCKPENMPENIEIALRTKTYADKDKIISLYRNFEKPSYHVIGNHDCDMCSKKQILEYYGVDYDPYYSFDMGGCHFIVLDPNYYMLDGKYISYENGNYFDASYNTPPSLPYFPDEQLEWLKNDLAATDKPSVLFTHQSLQKGGRKCGQIRNPDALHEVLKNAPHRVLMSLNGHAHIDHVEKQNGIYFVNINSASCMWMGKKFTHMGRYTAEIDEKYPNIRFVLPYRDPVFAIYELDDKGATVKGVKSEFVGVDQKEYENPEFAQLVPTYSASTQHRYLEF